MKFGMKALQTFRGKRETSNLQTGNAVESKIANDSSEGDGFHHTAQSSNLRKPIFFVQLLGIPLIAYVLTQISNQVKQDSKPLNWAKIQADLLLEKLQKSGWVFSDQTKEVLTKQQIEIAAHLKEQSIMMDIGSWAHFSLFLGAILVVYSFDLIMDMIHWDEKGVKLKSPLLIISLLLLFAGIVSMGWYWVAEGLFAYSNMYANTFSFQSLLRWFAQDWGFVLLLLVASYGFMAWKRLPFMAMVSPFIISFSIALLLMMPMDSGCWWLGDANKDLDAVQRYRILGIFLYLVGCFLLNVLLVQRLEKGKDWDSDSPNVWLLFAADFRLKKLKYRSEEPELASFPRFWWVPYFWLIVSAILVVFGLYFLIQGDDLFEKQMGSFSGFYSLDLYFERYAFRAMLFGFYYSLMLFLQDYIQWNRVYRILIELGLMILVL